MFLNSSLTINNVVSNVNLTTQNNELYENGIRVATQTDVDFLQQEINSLIPDNPNAWINSDGITSNGNRIPFTDNNPNGMTTTQSLTFVIDPQNNPTLTVGGTQMISVNNNMFLRSADNIETSNNIILKGPASIQTSFQHGTNNSNNYVKTYVDKDNFNFITDNQIGSVTEFKGASQYFFDNNIITSQNVIINQGNSLALNNDTDPSNIKLYKENGLDGNFFIDNQTGSKTTFKGANSYNFDNSLNIGSLNTSNKIFLNGSEFNGVSAGLLRSINCNLIKPTTIYDVVWSNLTAQEQLEWKGLDPSYSSPTQSLTGNYWNFTKTSPSSAKVGWFIPVDLSSLTFQDLESFWCVVRFNNNTSISTEGSLFFSIYTSPATAPNFYRTRINYQNPATPINQTGYFYKIHCQDTITTTTANNSGRAQEVGQTKIKTNPCEVRPDLYHIPFNKVPALSGDTSQGYTNAPILAISLQTASNIHTFDFDVVSIGYLDKQYNLFFAP
jgi:hypothetical protein